MKNYYELPPYLHLPDMMAVFGAAESTIRRWVREARAGKNRFPLPIDMRNGRGKLFWTRESIIAFQQQAEPQPTPDVESAASRNKRHAAAMKELEAIGVKLAGHSEPQTKTAKGGAK